MKLLFAFFLSSVLAPAIAHAETLEWQTADGYDASMHIPAGTLDTEFETSLDWYHHVDDQTYATYDEAFDLAIHQVRVLRLHEPIAFLAHRHGPIRLVEETLSFVSTIVPYGTDGGAIRLPAQMLGVGYGDCDDKALLATAILTVLGMDAGIWHLHHYPHAGLAVSLSQTSILSYRGYSSITTTEEGSWYFAETTARGWRVGELPIADFNVGELLRPPHHDI